MFLLLLGSALAQAPDAEALARTVSERCGDPYALDEVAFTFVVVRDGEEVARRSHRWQPSAGTLTSGEVSLKVTGEMPTDPSDPRWAELAPGVDPEAATKAWAAFVNDGYWLLAPCKVTDPGVRRSVDEQGRLVLAFDGVGFTPGDTYRLEVDGEGRVTGWSFTLQSGSEGAFDWTEHTRVGPLEVSLDRKAREGDFRIRFEDVVAR